MGEIDEMAQVANVTLQATELSVKALWKLKSFLWACMKGTVKTGINTGKSIKQYKDDKALKEKYDRIGEVPYDVFQYHHPDNSTLRIPDVIYEDVLKEATDMGMRFNTIADFNASDGFKGVRFANQDISAIEMLSVKYMESHRAEHEEQIAKLSAEISTWEHQIKTCEAIMTDEVNLLDMGSLSNDEKETKSLRFRQAFHQSEKLAAAVASNHAQIDHIKDIMQFPSRPWSQEEVIAANEFAARHLDLTGATLDSLGEVPCTYRLSEIFQQDGALSDIPAGKRDYVVSPDNPSVVLEREYLPVVDIDGNIQSVSHIIGADIMIEGGGEMRIEFDDKDLTTQEYKEKLDEFLNGCGLSADNMGTVVQDKEKAHVLQSTYIEVAEMKRNREEIMSHAITNDNPILTQLNQIHDETLGAEIEKQMEDKRARIENADMSMEFSTARILDTSDNEHGILDIATKDADGRATIITLDANKQDIIVENGIVKVAAEPDYEFKTRSGIAKSNESKILKGSDIESTISSSAIKKKAGKSIAPTPAKTKASARTI